VIPSLRASAEEKWQNLPSDEFPISYLYNKVDELEGQLKRLEEDNDEMKKVVDEKDGEMKKIIDEKDDELKKMIEERDDKVNSIESQVKNLSSQLENFQGHSAIDLAFIVTATKTGNIPSGVIAFDDKVSDHSNSFDAEEGKFIVPSSGNYLFFFNSLTFNTGPSCVDVIVNNTPVYDFYESNGDSSHKDHQHNFIFASKLEKDDELYLVNYYSDTLYNGGSVPMTFVGYKAI